MSHTPQGSPAAFFDLDGTLIPRPPLEWRFLRLLRYRHLIGASHALSWMLGALRMMPRGVSAIRHGNKMHLRGISSDLSSVVPHFRIVFFPGAVRRAVEHAAEGHLLVLVSGTLEPLALLAARALERELAALGQKATVEVRATRLDESAGRWTGLVLGEPMNGPAKARAARQLAAERGCDLTRSYTYGNTSDDLWLLSAVGHPSAVHASRSLCRVARKTGWPILCWSDPKDSCARASLSGKRTPKPKVPLTENWGPLYEP